MMLPTFNGAFIAHFNLTAISICCHKSIYLPAFFTVCNTEGTFVIWQKGKYRALLTIVTFSHIKTQTLMTIYDPIVTSPREVSHKENSNLWTHTYDGIPSKNISVKNIKWQMAKGPRNFTVKVFSIEGAG